MRLEVRCWFELSYRQEVQLSLTNRPTLVHADVNSLTQNVKKHSFPAIRDLLVGFSDFCLPLSHFIPSMRGSPRAIGLTFGREH